MNTSVYSIPEGVRYMDKSLDLVFLASSAFITLAKMLSLGPGKSLTEVNILLSIEQNMVIIWKILIEVTHLINVSISNKLAGLCSIHQLCHAQP